MSFWLKAEICVLAFFILCSVLTVVAVALDNDIEPHYRWKVYYKFYLEDYAQTKYFRTHLGAKRFYRKRKKECKWIYIHRLKGE